MTPRVLVAGVGNVFLGDDAFGVEVANTLAAEELPAGVEVVEMGIRGVHLAYQVLEGYDGLVLLDAVDRGEPAGTLVVIDPDLAAGAPEPIDAHSLDPDSLLALLAGLAGRLGVPPAAVRIVGCQPLEVGEGIGLSPVVAAAVPGAAALAREVATTLQAELAAAGRAPEGQGPAGQGPAGQAGLGQAGHREEGRPCCDA